MVDVVVDPPNWVPAGTVVEVPEPDPLVVEVVEVDEGLVGVEPPAEVDAVVVVVDAVAPVVVVAGRVVVVVVVLTGVAPGT